MKLKNISPSQCFEKPAGIIAKKISEEEVVLVNIDVNDEEFFRLEGAAVQLWGLICDRGISVKNAVEELSKSLQNVDQVLLTNEVEELIAELEKNNLIEKK